ncbi:MAG: hypothetical protein JXA21_15700 [Anaerolineae bacterium]|nr:hypothetical protein [Anaerolineae bacterium]
MQGTKLIRYGILLSIILLLSGVGQGWAAPLTQDAVWMVSYPGEGSTISGVVNIQGTATHPAFVSYGILYASGDTVTGSTAWRHDDPIIWNNQSMVVNGTLGIWDTTTVPNGKYVLALVVYEAGNETPNVYFVQNLTVQNEDATPTPEPTIEPTPTEMGVAPTAEGAAPIAPTIEQPPTATPRPTPTLSPGVTPGPDEGGGDEDTPKTIISIDAVKEAFKTGAQLAIMLYVIGGLYVVVKAAIRYALRLQRKKQEP